MPYRFFYAYRLVRGTSHNFTKMEETQNNLPSFKWEPLFNLKELLDHLSITPFQYKNATGLISLEGLSDYSIRQKLKNATFISTGNFGPDSCLYFLYFIFRNGCCLCLFNGDEECFRALFFDRKYFKIEQIPNYQRN